MTIRRKVITRHLERVAVGFAGADPQRMIDRRHEDLAIADLAGARGGTVEESRLEDDDFSSNRHLALSFCLSMIFSENRYPLFRIML